MRTVLLTALLPLAIAAAPPAAVTTDPPADAAHPAAMAAFVIPAKDGGAMNAVMYTAAGAGPHPTLLLLHGFPGNEQNLDLAQAARRAGWNVLTLHYRGSWGSPSIFSFTHAVEDAGTALAWLREPATVTRFAIDPARIAVAGHSLGGLTAGTAAAHDPKALGAFLIDPADLAAFGRAFRTDKAKRENFRVNEVQGDLPPLAGTSEQAIMAEMDAAPPAIDLALAMRDLKGRPVSIVYARRGLAFEQPALDGAASAAGVRLSSAVWPTDHSFSDHRIALAARLVAWLGTLTSR